ncbi:GNAT family N-acetyltransferase [Pseudomonas chlororaphis]|jgi:hypothetical protein|uniref:GNAT family N-acetyltransferase n=1 Tax=Pseudomonas chlororaphis TaxID=587753 RepID=UPI002367BA65|nr:GNAT family N-acetyltransferase [Pseudomonas chlororaphis]WDG80448.1 GNAT family N-acetyltransferase [Pseudomonas chlororaphis]WDG86498.1 GNAT family N-acetyltransferase [Pseudomonas chlororaphis]
MIQRLKMKVFPRSEHADAYQTSEALLKDGKSAPFMEAGYYSSYDNEPLHFYLGESLVAIATLLLGEEMAELHKFYVHPKTRAGGIGLAAAQMALDHLFNAYGVQKVIVDMHGDSQGFWERVVETYAERAVVIEPNCYFLAPDQVAQAHYPWAFGG